MALHNGCFKHIDDRPKIRLSISLSIISVLVLSLIPINTSAQDDLIVDLVIDGKITSYEYEFSATFFNDDFMVFWYTGESIITIGLKVKTTGWIALGIDPDSRMKGADMIFAWVDSTGNTTIIDAYATGETGPHPPDTELGGTNDILEYAGTEEGGWTSIEFTKKLVTGDQYDKDIDISSKLSVIWAFGESDNFDEQHAERGSGTINFSTGESTSREEFPWLVHASIMISGFILLVSGNLVSMTMRKKSWWMKVHKKLQISGGIISLIGLSSAVYMVNINTGEHFAQLHSLLGLITIIFILSTFRAGMLITKPGGPRPRIRKFHKLWGKVTAAVMALTIFMGYSLVS